LVETFSIPLLVFLTMPGSSDTFTSEKQLKALVLSAGSDLCAVPTDDVVEIMRALPVKPLPGLPPFLKGLSIIRGAPVPVVDLDCLLALDGCPALTRFVTLKAGPRRIALLVEAILGVQAIDLNAFQETPPLLQAVKADFVQAIAAIDKQLLLLLRPIRVIPPSLWNEIIDSSAAEGTSGSDSFSG
jgi:purine-binding chemotaxis protein CheW